MSLQFYLLEIKFPGTSQRQNVGEGVKCIPFQPKKIYECVFINIFLPTL